MPVEEQFVIPRASGPDPDGKGAKYLVLEMHHGRFESVVEVPAAFDLSRAQTAYQNGVLRVVSAAGRYSRRLNS